MILCLFFVSSLVTISVSHLLKVPKVDNELLLQDSLDSVQALLEGLHRRSVGKADEVVARAVKQVPSLSRVQIEENARHDLKNRNPKSVIVFHEEKAHVQSHR